MSGGPIWTWVSCSVQKAQETAPAGELYTSPLFRKAKAWALANSDEWWILSGLHGLVDPAEELEPYDHRIATDYHGAHAWGKRIQASLAGVLVDRDRSQWPSQVVILAGRDYVGPILKWTAITRVAQVFHPLHGLAVGERLAWFNARNTQ